jgi:hypothetical protein
MKRRAPQRRGLSLADTGLTTAPKRAKLTNSQHASPEQQQPGGTQTSPDQCTADEDHYETFQIHPSKPSSTAVNAGRSEVQKEE